MMPQHILHLFFLLTILELGDLLSLRVPQQVSSPHGSSSSSSSSSSSKWKGMDSRRSQSSLPWPSSPSPLTSPLTSLSSDSPSPSPSNTLEPSHKYKRFRYSPHKRHLREAMERPPPPPPHPPHGGDGNDGMMNQQQQRQHPLPRLSIQDIQQRDLNMQSIIEAAQAGYSTLAFSLFEELCQKDSHAITIKDCNVLLRELGDRGETRISGQIFEKMQTYPRLRPSLITYTTLISRAGAWQKVQLAQAYFKKMQEAGLAPDVQTFNSLINAYVKGGQLQAAVEVLATMIRSKVNPTVVTLNTLIDGCARTGDHQQATKLLHLFQQMEITPNLRTYSTLIHVYCQANDLVEAEKVFHSLGMVGLQANTAIYSTLIHAYGSAGKLQEAFALLDEMRSRGLTPNIVTISSALHFCGRWGALDQAFQLYRTLLPPEGSNSPLLANSITCSSLIDCCLKAGDVDNAFSVLRDMHRFNISLTAVTYTSLLVGLSRLHQTHRLEEILPILHPDRCSTTTTTSTSTMTTAAVAVSPRDLLVELLNTQCPSTALDLLEQANALIQPNDYIDAIILVFNRLQTVEERNKARQLLHQVPKNEYNSFLLDQLEGDLDRVESLHGSSNKNAFSKVVESQYEEEVSKLMEGYRLQNDYPSVISLYEKMKSTGVGLNVEAYRSDRKNSDQEALFRLYLVLQEMRKADIEPDTTVYNTLIDACARCGELERGLELLQEMRNSGLQPDVITFTSLIKACANYEDADRAVIVAEEIFVAMQQRTNHFSTYVAPNQITFHCLIQTHLHVQPSNLSRIWELYLEMKAMSLPIDSYVFNAVIRALCSTDAYDYRSRSHVSIHRIEQLLEDAKMMMGSSGGNGGGSGWQQVLGGMLQQAYDFAQLTGHLDHADRWEADLRRIALKANNNATTMPIMP
eukprot:gene2380-2615_t